MGMYLLSKEKCEVEPMLYLIVCETGHQNKIGYRPELGATVDLKAQSHIPSRTSSAPKNEELWSVGFDSLHGRASKVVDDLTRTSDERYSCIVCVNLCAHFLHVQKCERFSTCE